MKVLLVVIDGATPRVLGPAIQTGRLPVLQRLAEAGAFHDRCTTIFPSITPAATTSIITGDYPAASGILGASWMDQSTGEVAYFGDDFWVIAREGFREFVEEFLMRLNGDRLKAPTLFEIVERAGLTAGSLNYLVFKGLHQYEATVPKTLRLLPGVARKELVHGPSVFAMGNFVTTRTMRGKPLKERGGLLNRFGLDDASTSQLLCEIAEDRVFPDFTVAYFADNDYRSHEVGASDAYDVIERVDQALGRAFDAAGGLDAVLRDTYVVVTSDHGHCDVRSDRSSAAICLDDVLAEFRQAPLGKPWRDGDDIMICPNMRAAQVYFRRPTAARVTRAVRAIVADPRVDQVIYRGHDIDGAPDHVWIESARGALEFWRGARGATHAQDQFGNTWSWAGELLAVDGRVTDGRLEWRDYPNAFERVAGIMEHPDSATLWVTAKPGCEFELPGGAAHLGGSSHGALHSLESCCPLIVAGPTRIALPAEIRTVDIAPLCLQLLGLPSRYRIGAPRGMASPTPHVL